MEYRNQLSQRQDKGFVKSLMEEPYLDWETERGLAYDWFHNKNPDSLQKLVKSHSRMVIKLAARYRNYGVPISDLIQEGTIGLLESANRFDPDKDVRFSNYARWWVRAYIQEYILRNFSIVRTGTTSSHKTVFFNLNRIRQNLGYISSLSSLDELVNISEKLKVSIEEIKYIEARILGLDVSITPLEPLGYSDSQPIINKLTDDNHPNPEEQSITNFDNDKKSKLIVKSMGCLDHREKCIISRRRLQDPGETLEEIGKDMGLTKERIRQIENKALRKMKFYLMTHLKESRQFLS
jgi:RNA polymerase sigma-32 factor